MSKLMMSFFIILSLFMLSACTSTVRNANYKLYKTRLQAQSYLTGKAYKPVPMIRRQIRQKRGASRLQRIANRTKSCCLATRKPVRKPIGKSVKVTAYKAKKRGRSVDKRPPVRSVVRKVKARYQYRPSVSRPVVRRVKAKKHDKPRTVYKRPIARKVYVQRKKIKRPVIHQARVARRAKAVYQRPVVRKVYVAPAKRVIPKAPKPTAPPLPLNELNERLFSAAKAGNMAQITALLNQGAQIGFANASRETPLHAAATLGRSAAVSFLLQKGANPNAKTSGGWTPLHSAARFKQTQAARLLVAQGAQINARNGQGKTPVALAQQVGATATAAALIGLGGR